MVAVLQDAIKCLKIRGSVADYPAKLLSRQARRWLLAADTNRPYSFLWICRGLELDSGAVRSRLGLGSQDEQGWLALGPLDSSDAAPPAQAGDRRLGRR